MAVRTLIDMLNGRPTDEVVEARELLIERGPVVVPLLAERLGELGVFGKLAAIEVLESLQDDPACAGLQWLLLDGAHTVRQSAATALGELGCTEAVAALTRLDRRMRLEQEPPHYGGPVAVRTALTRLGARVAVLPPVTGSLARSRAMVGGSFEILCWPAPRLAEVVNELAVHRQVVVHLRLWPVTEDGHVVWVMGRALDRTFNWSASWKENVEQSHAAALAYAAGIPSGRELVVEVEWIDERDVL